MAEELSSKSDQADFAAALLDPVRATPPGLLSPEGTPAAKRFSVYRNNVTVSLVNALSEVFPTVQNLVGEEFFRAMARIYVGRHPPKSRLLFEYGQDFPDFLQHFEPARELPFLPDVARLERLWLDSFHAADAAPLDGAVLSLVPRERMGDLRFKPHPATRVFLSDCASVSIVSRDRVGAPLDDVDPLEPEDGLVTRPEYDPELRHLPPGGADFFQTLLSGGSLAQAATAATVPEADFDLAAAIGAALQSGAFAAAILDGEELR